MDTITVETGFVWNVGGGSVSVIDNLLSTSPTAALSANQGRVLKGLIDEIPGSGGDADTLQGQNGAYYRDRTNHTGTQAPATVSQDVNNRFVTDAQIASWNAKQAALGFTPENIANKGIAGGYIGSDGNNKIDPIHLPAIALYSLQAVANQAARLVATRTDGSPLQLGDGIKQLDTGVTYSLSAFPQTDLGNWIEIGDMTPDWSAIENKPTTFPPIIGSEGNQAVAGNDSRLTDARTPLAHNHPISQVTGLQTALDLLAPLADPAFSGVPTAPTATAGTNTTQVASTAFVKTAVDAVPAGRNVAVYEQSTPPTGGTYYAGDVWIYTP